MAVVLRMSASDCICTLAWSMRTRSRDDGRDDGCLVMMGVMVSEMIAVRSL
jgi:hypothetical protein